MPSIPIPPITPAQREALHARGLTDEEMVQLTPLERQKFIASFTPEEGQKLFNGGNADRSKPVPGFDLSNPPAAEVAANSDEPEPAPITDRPNPPPDELPEREPAASVTPLITPNSREVRESITTLVAQAKAATKHIVEEEKHPGLLQMVLVHPADEKVSGIYRYDLGDPNLIEELIKDAVNASKSGHNVYIEGRTVRRGLASKQRGGLADTVAVFALVVDSDADKGKAWTPTVPTSLAVETSPGNTHFWFFLENAVDADTGKALGDWLRTATNADADTGNVCQPYRVAGTVNYPGKKKLERGRVITPTHSLGFDPGTLWTPERFEQDFPAPAEPISGGTSSEGGTGSADESTIPADTLRVIREGVEDDADRSYIFYNVVKALNEDGWALTDIFTLLDRYPKGIASKYRGRLQREVERIWAKLGERREQKPAPTNLPAILSQKDFLAGYVAPDYILDGILQRRFIYSFTAVTGHGKTALALLLAQAVGSADPNATFGGHAAEKGQVIYLVGENPDDVRCRIIGANCKRSDDPDRDRIHFIPGVFDIAELHEQLMIAIDKLGGVDLVIVDTSAAYFLKEDENSQMGEHARTLRSLTTLPGGPCVVVLCHPIKHVTEPSQLLPRGGGAFTAEIDGNLTGWKHDETLVTFHHSPDKFRGPGFEPITFKLEKIDTTQLVDSKGRMIPTVHAIALSEQEEEAQEASAERDEDKLLAALAGKKALSIADLARACNWTLTNGELYKSKVQRIIQRLQTDRLVKRVRSNKYRLTDEGRKIDTDDEDDTIENRSGAVGSEKPFHPLRGMKLRPTVPCAFCSQTGDVYQFADGRRPKGQRRHSALHEGCAEPFFTGKQKPQNNGGVNSSPLAE